MQGTSDPVCSSRGIPCHLHQCGRQSDPVFTPNEVAYRWHPPEVTDPKNLISFKKKNSSVNRSKYCKDSADVLICDRTGTVKPHHVASFPISFFNGRAWKKQKTEGGVSAEIEVTVTIEHAPLPCNYAHCDLVVRENGQVVDELKGVLRLQIRTEVERFLQRQHPAKGPW